MLIARRRLLEAAAGIAFASFSACGAHRHQTNAPVGASDRKPLPGFDSTVFGFGPEDGAPILLLHELPGMTPDDIRLAVSLGEKKFRVFVPLLFGAIGQESTLKGYWQACVRGEFECTTRAMRSPVLDRLDRVVDRIVSVSDRPLGIIGMCLTGILPLALLRDEVEAAVLCQPTLPFNSLRFRPTGSQRSDIGLGAADVAKASRSVVPFLSLRYANDSLCPPERIATLEATFPGRMAVVTVPGDGHSTLASSFDQKAYDDTLTYLGVRLGTMSGPQMMGVAKQGGAACEITAEGRWRALPKVGETETRGRRER